MTGDQDREQLFAFIRGAAVDDGERLDARHIKLQKLLQHVVFTLGKLWKSFLDRNHVIV